MRGLRTWIGYRQTGLAYERATRFAGEPKYTFSGLVKLGLDGIFNFSYRPLQIITYIGVMVAMFALLLGLAILLSTIAGFIMPECLT